MLRFVSTLEYCPADSTVFLVSPFDIRRLIRNQMVAPRLVSVGYSLQISNERRLRTHAQRPTHSPSNRRLFLGRSLCRGTRKSRGRTQRNDRATLSKWRGGQGEGVRGRGGQGEGGERREGGRILIKTNCISL